MPRLAGLVLLLVVSACAASQGGRSTTPANANPLVDSGPRIVVGDHWLWSQFRVGPFVVSADVFLRRPFQEGETLTLVLRQGARVLERVTPQFPGNANDFVTGALHAPGPGHYQVDLLQNGRVIGTQAFVGGVVPCIGGGKVLRAYRERGTRLLLLGRGSEALGYLAIDRWESQDGDWAHYVEWFRDGKSMHVDEGAENDLSRWFAEIESAQSLRNVHPLSQVCPFTFGREQYAIPRGLLTLPGAWEVRVYREGQPSLSFSFRVLADALPNAVVAGLEKGETEGDPVERRRYDRLTLVPTSIATPPEMTARLARVKRYEHKPGGEYPHLAPATAAELRALIRSPEALQKRFELNALMVVPQLTVTTSLSNEEDYRLSPEQKWRRHKQNEAAAYRNLRVEVAKKRARAKRLLPAWKKVVKEHSQPFSEAEWPK